jgi:hypothetical protein
MRCATIGLRGMVLLVPLKTHRLSVMRQRNGDFGLPVTQTSQFMIGLQIIYSLRGKAKKAKWHGKHGGLDPGALALDAIIYQ